MCSRYSTAYSMCRFAHHAVHAATVTVPDVCAPKRTVIIDNSASSGYH